MEFLRMILVAAKWIAAGYIAVLLAVLAAWAVVAVLNACGAGL